MPKPRWNRIPLKKRIARIVLEKPFGEEIRAVIETIDPFNLKVWTSQLINSFRTDVNKRKTWFATTTTEERAQTFARIEAKLRERGLLERAKELKPLMLGEESERENI